MLQEPFNHGGDTGEVGGGVKVEKSLRWLCKEV